MFQKRHSVNEDPNSHKQISAYHGCVLPWKVVEKRHQWNHWTDLEALPKFAICCFLSKELRKCGWCRRNKKIVSSRLPRVLNHERAGTLHANSSRIHIFALAINAWWIRLPMVVKEQTKIPRMGSLQTSGKVLAKRKCLPTLDITKSRPRCTSRNTSLFEQRHLYRRWREYHFRRRIGNHQYFPVHVSLFGHAHFLYDLPYCLRGRAYTVLARQYLKRGIGSDKIWTCWLRWTSEGYLPLGSSW